MFEKIIKPGIVLFAISFIAALILGVAYEVTKDPIAEQAEKARNLAMQEVLTKATSFEDLEITNEVISDVFVGKDGEEIIGYTIFTNPKGFEGAIELITGIDTEGAVTGVSIVDMSETPGLGDNAKNEEFRNQYIGKDKEIIVTKIAPAKENEIVAITSATITSKAITVGVNDAMEFFNNELREVE